VRQIEVELPDEVAEHLEQQGRDLSRWALEALAVDAYRAGELTSAQVQQLLGLASRWETEAFLKERQAYLQYSESDLDADIQAIRSVTRS
jgi:predicted HTH domain antitoxin